MEILRSIQTSYNQKRLNNIINNEFFKIELKTLNNDTVLKYYQYIIDNIDLDKSNIKNSYIMWIYDKVDQIDLTKQCDITPGKTSYPDIDVDFMAERRDEVVQYIREKYGNDRVAQIATVGRMMGRGVIKDLCRVYDIAYDEVNRITDFIPDEAKIADELQHMSDAGEKPSIVLWALQNHPEELKQWAYIEDGEVKGKYGHIFAQAIRLEGTARSTGKHASGLVISPYILEEFCPMLHDKKSDNLICGLELEDLEAYGLVKMDILGLKTLSCVNTTLELING